MRSRVLRAGLLAQVVWAALALCASGAAAQPASGPRETVDQPLTTVHPNSPTGVGYTGVYHAAGNAQGNPPYLRRIVFHPPRGMRYDTTVPERCLASDVELEARGPDACPAGSRIGSGNVEGLFEEPVGHDFLVDHYKHTADVMNGAGQQIVLIKSEGYTVVRGRFRPDGSVEFVPTTCFPAPPAGGCADDYIRQLKASSLIPAYTRTSGGRVRSYATTPPRCPARRYWRMGVRFWWSDGSVDSLVNKEPCTRPRKRHRRGKKVADERTRH